MIGTFKKWFRGRPTSKGKSATAARPADTTGERRSTTRDRRQGADYVDPDPDLSGSIEDDGPGKNKLVRNKYKREDTGTHETLTIVDDSVVDSGEETGIDPYNTGNFDRSRNWDKRFRN